MLEGQVAVVAVADEVLAICEALVLDEISVRWKMREMTLFHLMKMESFGRMSVE